MGGACGADPTPGAIARQTRRRATIRVLAADAAARAAHKGGVGVPEPDRRRGDGEPAPKQRAQDAAPRLTGTDQLREGIDTRRVRSGSFDASSIGQRYLPPIVAAIRSERTG